MENGLNWREKLITRVIRLTGYSAILFAVMIFIYLMKEGLPALGEVNLSNLASARWYPIENYFGILPLIGGTLLVTVGASLFAVPVGIFTAVFIAEIAPQWAREILKPFVEILAGIPSVVLGFFGILILAPNLRRLLDLPTGLTALAGALLLAATSLPTIVSISEDALYAVPKSFRDDSLALGVTRWHTIWMVVVPAAKAGIVTAVMLGMGRAIGETMAVMMVTGNAARLPLELDAVLRPVRTMTATIAAEMGEVAQGSTHYHVLFGAGIILFVLTFLINLAVASALFQRRGGRGLR